LGFEGSVLKRADASYRAGRSRAWLKHKARHLTTAHVHAITVNDDRGRLALCDLADVDRCWAIARRAERGDVVTTAYSRRDAGGGLREARVVVDGETGSAV
jgi:hypothetical protein